MNRNNMPITLPAGISRPWTRPSQTGNANNGIVYNPQFTLVYFVNYGDGSSAIAGGLNGFGRSASGWFNQQGQFDTGLTTGQTVNYPNADNGYWRMFVDLNGDGNYGTYDSSTGLFIPDNNEMINNTSFVNSQGFQTGVGTISAGDISGWYTVPEPTTCALLALGVSALALSSGTNIIHFRIAVTNLNSFRVEYRDCLTNATWSNLGPFSVTGAVMTVTDTNTAPQRFYRAVSP